MTYDYHNETISIEHERRVQQDSPVNRWEASGLRRLKLAINLLAAFLLLGFFNGIAIAGDFSGLALLVVYPDYPVNTDTFYGYTTQVGHAGVLLIKKDGLTKYYEFGRYDAAKKGEVRKVTIPDVTMSGGKPTESSLKAVLKELSSKSGRNGRIRAALFLNMDFDAMNDLALKRMSGSGLDQYSASSFNCGHFAEQIVLAGNPKVDRPTILVPVPNNFVDEYIEEKNAEVLYDRTNDTIEVGIGDESDAKLP